MHSIFNLKKAADHVIFLSMLHFDEHSRSGLPDVSRYMIPKPEKCT
jgi:hypothetical protein